MSKVILVIEMPKSCSECMFCKRNKSDDFYQFEEEICSFTQQRIHHDTKSEDRNCPLKEVPEEESRSNSMDEYEDGWADGFNYLRSMILGEIDYE